MYGANLNYELRLASALKQRYCKGQIYLSTLFFQEYLLFKQAGLKMMSLSWILFFLLHLSQLFEDLNSSIKWSNRMQTDIMEAFCLQ